MIGFATAPQYRHHLEPLGLDITDRRVTNHPFVVVASRKDARGMRPVRTAQVAVIEHGAGQRYHMDAGGPDEPHDNVTLFLCPSKRVADQSQHLWPNARSVVVGSPRLEHLTEVRRAASKFDKVALSFHWNSPVAPESMSAWKHYQTVLPLLADFPLIGHAHPGIRGKLKPWYTRGGVEWVEDWADVVRQAAVLVVDNSSIMWEACALGIPVVVLNAPWYRRNQEFGLRFWEWADIGPQVEHPKDLVPALDAVMGNDKWSNRRAKAARFVYGQVEGSTARALDALGGWAE